MPELVRAIAGTMTKIQQDGVAILLVEQNVKIALGITRRTYLIEKGNIRWEPLRTSRAMMTRGGAISASERPTTKGAS